MLRCRKRNEDWTLGRTVSWCDVNGTLKCPFVSLMNWGEWPGGREKLPSLEDVKKHCMQQLAAMRSDHMRALNPTPFKVCHMCHYNFILFSLFMMLTDPCYWYCFRVCFCRFVVTVQWPVIVNPRLMSSLVFSLGSNWLHRLSITMQYLGIGHSSDNSSL